MATQGNKKYLDWLQPEKLMLLTGWARNGLTDEQISHNIGISRSTLKEWKKRFIEVDAALKEGKEVADLAVENALYKSAVGYYVTIKKPIKVKTVKQDGKKRIEEEHVEHVEESIYIPPSNTAQIYWLKNRRPDVWREKPQPQGDNVDRVVIVDDFK